MIQPLRTAHRRLVLGLAVLLPAILASAFLARHPDSPVKSNHPRMDSSLQLLTKSGSLWRKHPIATEFYVDANLKKYVAIVPEEDLAEPDLLLYWTGGSADDTALPEQSVLIGAFAPGKRFQLPQDAPAGAFILYSLPHGLIVDSTIPGSLP